jgi:hypothetical protein
MCWHVMPSSGVQNPNKAPHYDVTIFCMIFQIQMLRLPVYSNKISSSKQAHTQTWFTPTFRENQYKKKKT